jgi:hypothetical protein
MSDDVLGGDPGEYPAVPALPAWLTEEIHEPDGARGHARRAVEIRRREAVALEQRVLALLAAHSGAHPLSTRVQGERYVEARGVLDGIPVAAVIWALDEGPDGGLSGRIAARAPLGGAEVLVRPQGVGDTVLLALHLRHVVVLGKRAFDAAFVIQGEPAAARAVLSSPVRAALLKRPQSALLVKDGEACVVLASGPPTNALTDALAVLRALRP